MKDNGDITKEIVEQFEEIRLSGKYNMFMEGAIVAEKLGLCVDSYLYLLFNYATLKNKYLGK